MERTKSSIAAAALADRRAPAWPVTARAPAAIALALAIGLGACDRGAGPAGRGQAADTTAAGARASEPERLARAALAEGEIPLYPGAEGLDATEFEKNRQPFIAVDFFTLEPPAKVAAFYDEALGDRVARRDTTIEPGTVRYEFREELAGLAVKPWDPQGVDSTAMLTRFDRRDALGVSTPELDRYGTFLSRARAHVVANLPRPEPFD